MGRGVDRMHLGPFTWDVFSQLASALATLLTGAGAVAAAYVVGKRQADIQLKQADLQADQTKILSSQLIVEQLRLRRDLFDERLKVYDNVRAWLSEVVEKSQTPEAGSELELGMAEAMDRSRFLFRSEVHPSLLKLQRLGMQVRKRQEELNQPSYMYALPSLGFDPNAYKKTALKAAVAEVRKALDSLSDVFGDELKLRDS